MTFADENGVDGEDVYTKADTIKVPYDKNDPVYWFRRLEIAVASYDLRTQWDGALDMADDVYYALKAGAEVAAVNLDEKAPELQRDVGETEVAAVTRTAKEFDINDRQTWGRYHSDFKGKSPPNKICFQHYRWGKQAHFCRGTGDCPWQDYTAPNSK